MNPLFNNCSCNASLLLFTENSVQDVYCTTVHFVRPLRIYFTCLCWCLKLWYFVNVLHPYLRALYCKSTASKLSKIDKIKCLALYFTSSKSIAILLYLCTNITESFFVLYCTLLEYSISIACAWIMYNETYWKVMLFVVTLIILLQPSCSRF